MCFNEPGGRKEGRKEERGGSRGHEWHLPVVNQSDWSQVWMCEAMLSFHIQCWAQQKVIQFQVKTKTLKGWDQVRLGQDPTCLHQEINEYRWEQPVQVICPCVMPPARFGLKTATLIWQAGNANADSFANSIAQTSAEPGSWLLILEKRRKRHSPPVYINEAEVKQSNSSRFLGIAIAYILCHHK